MRHVHKRQQDEQHLERGNHIEWQAADVSEQLERGTTMRRPRRWNVEHRRRSREWKSHQKNGLTATVVPSDALRVSESVRQSPNSHSKNQRTHDRTSIRERVERDVENLAGARTSLSCRSQGERAPAPTECANETWKSPRRNHTTHERERLYRHIDHCRKRHREHGTAEHT
jgi:hypothetical protein